MKNNFDELIDRHNMNSSKYDELFQIYKEKDIRPFTVADMDFKTDENILKAIIAKVNKGILAYTSTPIEYFLAYKNWYKKTNKQLVMPIIQTLKIQLLAIFNSLLRIFLFFKLLF